MTINLSVPQTMQELRPRITVIGVGGAGCNAVNNMIEANLEGVDFLVANTDGQSLVIQWPPEKFSWAPVNWWLGAGSKPDMGRKAEESLDEVLAELAAVTWFSSQPVWAAAQAQVLPLLLPEQQESAAF